jgi:hypothetical protein
MIKVAVEALPLQQEVHRLPVIPGRLRPRLRDLPGPKPVRQGQQLPADRPERPGLLLPASGPGVARHPDGDHDLFLADVDTSDPVGEQRLVFCLFHRGSYHEYADTVVAVRRSCGQAEIWSAGSKHQFTAL